MRRKRRTSLYRREATLDPSTRKTCWRETWGLALLRLSPGRPEAVGVTSNPGLSACAAPRLRPAPPTANGVTGRGIWEEPTGRRRYNSSRKVAHPHRADVHSETHSQRERKTITEAIALPLTMLMICFAPVSRNFNSWNRMINPVHLKRLMSSHKHKQEAEVDTCVCVCVCVCVNCALFTVSSIIMRCLWWKYNILSHINYSREQLHGTFNNILSFRENQSWVPTVIESYVISLHQLKLYFFCFLVPTLLCSSRTPY